MKEYKCVEIEVYACETEAMLNDYAEDGWKLICSYAWHGRFLILEREKPKHDTCSECGQKIKLGKTK